MALIQGCVAMFSEIVESHILICWFLGGYAGACTSMPSTFFFDMSTSGKLT